MKDSIGAFISQGLWNEKRTKGRVEEGNRSSLRPCADLSMHEFI